MAVPKNDKHKEYASYAEHCLEMVPVAPNQEYRAIQREMAAEWIRLAELHSSAAKADEMIQGDGGRLMCGWPPTCKSFFREEHWSLAVMCPAFRCDLT